jgi:hypothetical protein
LEFLGLTRIWRGRTRLSSGAKCNPGVTEGARYSFSPSRLCPLETEQKAGVRNGKPDFSLRNQCGRRGCTSRRNPPCIPQSAAYRSLNRLFDVSSTRSAINHLKTRASNYYLPTRDCLLERIVNGKLVHADETIANIKGKLAYVWVLTNLHEVVYILAETREGELERNPFRLCRGLGVRRGHSRRP